MSSPVGGQCSKLHYPLMNEFRLQEKFCDLVIKVEDRKFPCHQCILASTLQYFRNVFSGDYKEAEMKEIELKGIRAEDFELLLTHIYNGDVRFNEENAYRLLKMSNYLCLPNLEQTCVDYLVASAETITTDSLAFLFVFASQVGQKILLEKFVKFVAEKFTTVSKCEIFKRVSGADLLTVLGHPNLKKDSIAVLDFLAEWVDLQTDEDRKLLPDMLNAAKLDKIPSEWLVRVITSKSNRPSVTSDENVSTNSKKINCEGILGDLFFDGMDIYENKVSSKPKEALLPFVLFTYEGGDDGKYDVTTYKLESCDGTDLNPVAKIISGHGITHYTKLCKSVFVDGLNYVIRSDGTGKQLEMYMGQEFKCYQKLSSYIWPWGLLKNLQVTSYGTKIYLYQDGYFSMFNCHTNEWFNMTDSIFSSSSLPRKVSKANLLTYRGCLYLIGGVDLLPNQKDISRHSKFNGKYFQRYAIDNNSWCEFPSTIHGHSQHASCIYNDVLYVAGGDNLSYYKGYVECYDFRAGIWRNLGTLMPAPKLNHTLLGYENKLWFFGGQKYDNNSNSLLEDLTWYSYDLRNCTWSSISPISSDTPQNIIKILDVVTA